MNRGGTYDNLYGIGIWWKHAGKKKLLIQRFNPIQLLKRAIYNIGYKKFPRRIFIRAFQY